MVAAVGFAQLAKHPGQREGSQQALTTAHGGSAWVMQGTTVLAFPRLVLRLSGVRDWGEHDAAGQSRRASPQGSGWRCGSATPVVC